MEWNHTQNDLWRKGHPLGIPLATPLLFGLGILEKVGKSVVGAWDLQIRPPHFLVGALFFSTVLLSVLLGGGGGGGAAPVPRGAPRGQGDPCSAGQAEGGEAPRWRGGVDLVVGARGCPSEGNAGGLGQGLE